MNARTNVLLQASERFGHMLSRTLLTVLYYGVLGPFAVVYRVVADPLHLRRRAAGNWSPWTGRNDTLEPKTAAGQFDTGACSSARSRLACLCVTRASADCPFHNRT